MPVTVAARFSACEPMSPMAPVLPLRAGSIRHRAFLSFASTGLDNQPWWYCTVILHTWPRGALHGGHQRIGLGAGVHQRLVAHHMKTGLDKGQRHRVVQVIRGDDADQID